MPSRGGFGIVHITKHRTMALVTIAQFVQSGSEIRSGKCVFDWVNPVGFISVPLWVDSQMEEGRTALALGAAVRLTFAT